jgi:hypothetical protein
MKSQAKVITTHELQTYDKTITGFKMTQAERPPKQEGKPFLRSDYAPLTTNTSPKGWNSTTSGQFIPIGRF